SSVGSVDLRLARVHDRPALDELARLDAKPAPIGQMVLAVVGERIVAGLPLDGGVAIRDPFVATQHLVPLLEGRAAQLRAPPRRTSPGAAPASPRRPARRSPPPAADGSPRPSRPTAPCRAATRSWRRSTSSRASRGAPDSCARRSAG